MRRWTIAKLLLVVLIWAAPAQAVEPDEMLDDPVLESRARDISANLRCVVCKNQNVDNSAAKIAKDMRLIVRERLVAGDSDEQIYTYLTDRYGDFVLLYPAFKPQTFVLWFGPLFLLLAGGWAVFRYVRNAGADPAGETSAALNPDEEARLKALLTDGERA